MGDSTGKSSWSAKPKGPKICAHPECESGECQYSEKQALQRIDVRVLHCSRRFSSALEGTTLARRWHADPNAKHVNAKVTPNLQYLLQHSSPKR